MNLLVRKVLIEIARDKKNPIVGYQELSDICDLGFNMKNNPKDRQEIGQILGEISEYEHNHGRPLLSALVLRISEW